jgi:RND family efflux transporter MFP subunit
VEAYTKGEVHTEVAGLVEEFPVTEGDFVEKGQVLAELGSSQLVLQLEETEEELAQAQVLYDKEKRERKRFEMLSQSSSISPQTLEKEQSEADSARFLLRRLKAAIRILEDRISKKTIRAPFNGYIVAEHVHVGMWLGIGGAIVSMVQVDPIYVTIPFPQKQLFQIRTGQSVDVTVDGLADRVFTGSIEAIVAQGDEASRTFPVKVRLENSEHILKPGMLTHVRFSVGSARKTLTVPKDAVVTTPDQKKILYRVQDGEAEPVPVKTGFSTESYVEVQAEGLRAGQQVVSVGNERLRPGQPVTIVGALRSEEASVSPETSRSASGE